MPVIESRSEIDTYYLMNWGYDGMWDNGFYTLASDSNGTQTTYISNIIKLYTMIFNKHFLPSSILMAMALALFSLARNRKILPLMVILGRTCQGTVIT